MFYKKLINIFKRNTYFRAIKNSFFALRLSLKECKIEFIILFSALIISGLSEVLLITDINHSLPIKSESNEFFCNANGSGRPEIIICSYNPLVWNEDIVLDQIFYTSGLGGIYPKNIKVGYIKSIEKIVQILLIWRLSYLLIHLMITCLEY